MDDKHGFGKRTVAVVVAAILVVSIILYIQYAQYKTPIIRYKGTEDIVVSEQTITGTALIKEIQTFKKENTPYIQFDIDILEYADNSDKWATLDTEYIFTQEQFDSRFGAENNAFDYEEYSISYEALVQQDSSIFGPVRNLAFLHDLSYTNALHPRNYLTCKEYSELAEIDNIKVFFNKRELSLTLYITMKSRANFLGENTFTEEEKEQHKRMIDQMCIDILRMLDKEETKFTWEECEG